MDYITLIDRYYSGATSREEEEVLRRYLKGDNLPQEVLAERELLLSMLEPAVYDCSGAMDEVSAMVDSLAHEESMAVVPAHTARRVVLRYLLPALVVAASFALLFFLPYGGGGTVQPDASGSTSGLLAGGGGTSDTADNASVSSANEILIVLAEEPPVIVEAVNTVQPTSTETGNRLLASNASVAVPMLEPRTGCASSLHDVQTKDVLIGVLDSLNSCTVSQDLRSSWSSLSCLQNKPSCRLSILSSHGECNRILCSIASLNLNSCILHLVSRCRFLTRHKCQRQSNEQIE